MRRVSQDSLRGAALMTALPSLLLAACAPGSPAPEERPLPTFAAAGGDRDCRCVTTGECPTADAFQGRSEDRGFQCRWDDRAAGRATCTYESRFRHDAPGAAWSSWSRTTISLRHTGDRGWCWTDRASRNDLTGPPPEENHPPAIRQPTEAEAQRVAAGCGTRARRATMPPNLLRMAPWGVHEPVEGATEAQRRCFMREIRRLIARPAAG